MPNNKLDILVLLRETSDPRPPARVTTRGAAISDRGLRRVPNPSDIAALEEALHLKDNLGARVTVLAVGPERLDDTLRLAFSMGADRGVRFWDHGVEGGDAAADARILARITKILAPDLVFTGSRMADRGDEPVPALAAAAAGRPCLSAVVAFTPKKESVEAERKSDRGARQTVTAPFPCTVLFEEVRTPRYPSMDAITKSLNVPVEIWDLAHLGLPFWEIGAAGAYLDSADYGVPRPDPVRVVTPDPNLPAFERILSLLSGGIKAREEKLHTLSIDDTAASLVRLFSEEGLLPGGRPMNYRLAHNVELVERERGIFLLSKAPLCVLRLNRSLADLVGRGAGGATIEPTEAEAPVMEQLASKGFVERLQGARQQPATLPEISIVIPVKDRAGELRRCLTSLANLNYPQDKLQVIVVDDGSSDDSPQVARQFQALLVPSGGTGRGPAAARNVGASLAGGEILAFIDSDCSASKEWLNELVPAFNDPAMAAVGGRVDGMCSASAVDRYESIMSSLSLGARGRSGSGGSDTFYLPSCNLLVRRSAFRSAGGFKDSMHVGEDVDLTWRLRDKGWTISYLPAGNVLHEHRSTIRSFMSRRFDYGTSEGMLQLLHPRRRKQMVVPPLLALVLMLCLAAPFTGWWMLPLAAGLLVADAAVVRVRFIRRRLPVGLPALLGGRLRALGSLAYYLSYHLVRYYALPLIVIALLVPGFWAWALPVAALLCAAGVDHAVRRPPLSFIRFCGIYLLEHIAYGAGVFWGCLSRRCFSSYRVVLQRHVEQMA